MFKKKKLRKKIPKRQPIKIKKRKSPIESRKKSNIFVIIFTWSIYISVAFYILFYSNLLIIKNLEISDTETSSEIQNIFKNMSEDKNLFKMSNINLLLFDKKKFESKIKDISKIKDVSVEKIFPDKLNITVLKHDFIIVTCKHERKEGQCAILDYETGKVQKENIDLNSNLIKQNKVLYIIIQNDFKNNEIVILPEILKQVKYFYKNITYSIDTNIPNEYYAKTIGMRDFYLITDEGWELRVDFTQNMEEILPRLRQLFNHEKDVQHRKDILFVDTRYGENITYKLKTDETKDKKSKKERIKK